jgi:hypothetical protein
MCGVMKLSAVKALAVGAIVVGAFVAGTFFSGEPAASSGAVKGDGSGAAVPPESGFHPATVELGRLPWHSTAEFSTDFVNREDETVVVAAVKSSCGCTGFDPKDYIGKTVRPGAALAVAGRLETTSRLGKRDSEIELMLTSGAIYVATIRYDGYATYDFSPRMLDFGAVDLDSLSGPTKEVVFRSDVSRVKEVEVDAPWASASRRSEGGVTTVFVGVDAQRLPHGKNFAQVTVHTSDAFQPEFSFRVSAEGVAALRASPGHVFASGQREAVVSFYHADGTPARIQNVTPEDPHLRFVKRYGSVLAITAQPGATPSSEARVFWVTDDQGAKTRFFYSLVK